MREGEACFLSSRCNSDRTVQAYLGVFGEPTAFPPAKHKLVFQVGNYSPSSSWILKLFYKPYRAFEGAEHAIKSQPPF